MTHPPLPSILNKYGQPKVAVPFTKGGRHYMVVGRDETGFILQRLDELQGNEEKQVHVTFNRFK